jgi:hypothetical protein
MEQAQLPVAHQSPSELVKHRIWEWCWRSAWNNLPSREALSFRVPPMKLSPIVLSESTGRQIYCRRCAVKAENWRGTYFGRRSINPGRKPGRSRRPISDRESVPQAQGKACYSLFSRIEPAEIRSSYSRQEPDVCSSSCWPSFPTPGSRSGRGREVQPCQSY